MKAPTQPRTERGYLEDMKLKQVDLLPDRPTANYTSNTFLIPIYMIKRFFDQPSGIPRRSFEKMSQVYAIGQGGK
jgi:alpha-D-ribose 1-methylphosphonate 5-phosphate C-P lyase